MTYRDEYAAATADQSQFWREKSTLIDWYKSPTSIVSTDTANNTYWFADGELNTAYLALDKHVDSGRAEQVALIYDSPVTGTKQQFTYAQLLDRVATLAGALARQGVVKGDRIVIYMPMIPEAVIAMLACARLGAIHSVVFGGFAAHELAMRINDAAPKAIISASCGIEIEKIIPYKMLLDAAIQEATEKPQFCVIKQRPQAVATLDPTRDFDFDAFVENATPIEPTPVCGTDPLYILYTSGTTGTPKGVVRDNGGHAVAMAYSMEAIYDMKLGDVFWAASDVGWVVGHSYIVYAPLIAGCTTILYEGKPIRTPDAAAFWRVCAEYQVNVLFTAPTAFRAICKEDPQGNGFHQYDMSSLKRIYLAGERLDPATYHWLRDITQREVIDHWWQTETGWAISSLPMGLENVTAKVGSSGLPTPGFEVKVVDEQGKLVPAGEQGSVVIKLPLPPGCLPTIWRNQARFEAGYLQAFPGYYLTGDGGYIDEDGYLYVLGRTDDVINVAGHRLSTGEIEEVVATHPAIAECAVVGVKDTLKGQIPIAAIVLKNGVTTPIEQIQQQLILRVRGQIGALACLKSISVVNRLPKTRSGKILRRIMRQIVDGESYQVPSTIEDVAVLDEITPTLRAVND